MLEFYRMSLGATGRVKNSSSFSTLFLVWLQKGGDIRLAKVYLRILPIKGKGATEAQTEAYSLDSKSKHQPRVWIDQKSISDIYEYICCFIDTDKEQECSIFLLGAYEMRYVTWWNTHKTTCKHFIPSINSTVVNP